MDANKLSEWNLPPSVVENYHKAGLENMFLWQSECLSLPNVLDGGNVVYSAPTSAGKSLVAEILLLKRFLKTKKKCIYILPYISLAREKMFSIRNMFEVCGIRVDGYMGSFSPSGGFASVDVAVCTIEKANALINKLIDEKKIHKLGMIIVDEIHMVGDENRGYLIELLLTKIRYMNEMQQLPFMKCKNMNISIVGMSATVPNLELLALWLDAEFYQTDFRPVPLQNFMKVGSAIFDNDLQKIRDCVPNDFLTNDEDNITSLCLETLATSHSVLIFCPTKNWCEKLAKSLAHQFAVLARNSKLGFVINVNSIRDVIDQLRRSPAGLDDVLRTTIPWAVAYHHAGLTTEERDIVETAFRNNVVRVLVATSTLSSGVNLPARRVIIRTPSFNRGTLDVRSYHQMAGRAGRKGIDDLGESILICKPHEKSKGKKLMTSALPPIKSCLVVDFDSPSQVTSAIRRAVLEIIVNGIATTYEQVKAYIGCTLLSAQIFLAQKSDHTRRQSTNSNLPSDQIIDNCITWLQNNEFIYLQLTNNHDISTATYSPTKLGKAALMSSLPTSEALRVLSDLQNASKAIALDCELHLVYQITPIYSLSNNLNWFNYLTLYENLCPAHRRVADLIGVDEGFLTRLAATGGLRSNQRLSEARQRQLNIHTRFYAALILHDLVQEIPLSKVCQKYGEHRGMVQSLQQSAATFAGMVTSFCEQLGWWSLEVLLREFQGRLVFGVHRELLDLMQISLLDSARARAFFNADLISCDDIANSSPVEIEKILRNSRRFTSKRTEEDDSAFIRGIRVPGTCKSVTEAEAAQIIYKEAKLICGLDDSAINDRKESKAHESESDFVSKASKELSKDSGVKTLNSCQESKLFEISKAQKNRNNRENEKSIYSNESRQESLNDLEQRNFDENQFKTLVSNKQNDLPELLSPNNASLKYNSSITGTQIAALMEDFESQSQNMHDCEKRTKPAASTPISHNAPKTSCLIPTSPRDISFNDLSGDMFDAPSTDCKYSANKPDLDWSTDSPFHFSSGQKSNDVTNCSNDAPFSNYIRCAQKNSNNSIQSVASDFSNLSVSNCQTFDICQSKPTCQSSDVRLNASKEFTSSIDKDRFTIIELSNNETSIDQFFQIWKNKSRFSLSLSTTKNDSMSHENNENSEALSGIAVYWGGQTVCCVDAKIIISKLGNNRKTSCNFVKIFKDAFHGFKQAVAVTFAVKRIVKLLLKHLDCETQHLAWQDPEIATWMLDPDREWSHNGMDLVETYCSEKSKALEELSMAPHGHVCADAVASFHVMDKIEAELRERSLWDPFVRIEMPHEVSMALLEWNGIAIDTIRLNKLTSELYGKKQSLQEEAWRVVGRQFNLLSVPEIRKIFRELGVANSSLGKYWSTSKDSLLHLSREANSHPLIPIIIDWRSIHYAFSCVQQITRSIQSSSQQDSSLRRYHPITQLTSTGKINMKIQFIPKTKHFTNDVSDSLEQYSFSLREFFVATEEFVLLAADYSQLELRMMAHLSGDGFLIEMFTSGVDLFRQLAARFYDKKDCPETVTEDERRVAKEIVYALNYGVGIKTLSSKIQLSESEIESIRSQFFDSYPQLQVYFKQIVENCRKQGCVRTLGGRRRYLRDINHRNIEMRAKAERQARNTSVAGSAADVVKAATLKIDEEMKKRGWNLTRHSSSKCSEESCFLIHQLHDELMYEVSCGLVKEAALIIRDSMINPLPLKVPLAVKIKSGQTWKNLEDYPIA